MVEVMAAALIALGGRRSRRLRRACGSGRSNGIDPGWRCSRSAAMIGRSLGGRFGRTITMSTMRGRRGCRFAHPGDSLPGQLLDRRNRLAVLRRHNADSGAGASSACRTADTVHVVIGMVRHVEIEDMADIWNVETTCGDVGGN